VTEWHVVVAIDLDLVASTLDKNGGVVSCELKWSLEDPYAVHLFCGENPVEWVFGRILLDQGTKDKSGDGDVVIAPVDEWITGFHLSSPDGEAVLYGPTNVIEYFLEITQNFSPIGEETPDIDALVANLLS
jgi:hypothetical protein